MITTWIGCPSNFDQNAGYVSISALKKYEAPKFKDFRCGIFFKKWDCLTEKYADRQPTIKSLSIVATPSIQPIRPTKTINIIYLLPSNTENEGKTYL
jgi:hypothetical protein